MSVTLALACLTSAIWCYLLFARGSFWRADCPNQLPNHIVTQLKKWPDICVIIPARNEADILPVTLPSLLTNEYPGALHTVLVDDRSEDGTAAVATQLAAQYNAAHRISIVTGSTLPPGWKGKVWAMQTGLEQAAAMQNLPRYILFTDADIVYEKGAIAHLVAEAEVDGLVLNSYMVQLRCRSIAERFLIPAFIYFFQMLYPFNWVNDAKHKVVAAAGGCMLIRHDALSLAGGMLPIRSALIDDCALGRQMKRLGPVKLSLTRDVHSVRPYPELRDIHAMVARSAYDQLGYSPLNLIGSMLGMVFTYILPVLLTVFASGLPQLLGAIVWVCMALSFVPIARFYSRSPFSGLALPAIATLYMFFTLDSAYQYRQGRGGLWKGRIQAGSTQGA